MVDVHGAASLTQRRRLSFYKQQGKWLCRSIGVIMPAVIFTTS